MPSRRETTAIRARRPASAAQPALGRAADVWGYPVAYLLSATVQLAGLPFLALVRRERARSDPMEEM